MEHVTMVDISAPYILVLDPETHYFYLPSLEMKDLTEETMVQFIEDVKTGKSAVSIKTDLMSHQKEIIYRYFCVLNRLVQLINCVMSVNSTLIGY